MLAKFAIILAALYFRVKGLKPSSLVRRPKSIAHDDDCMNGINYNILSTCVGVLRRSRIGVYRVFSPIMLRNST